MTATDLLSFFQQTRRRSEEICSFLEVEDYGIQPVFYVSPPKWHLGHTTWFFEEFVLKPSGNSYQCFHEQFSLIFNSYYETAGPKIPRDQRGNLSRPSLELVQEYRKYITDQLVRLLKGGSIPSHLLSVIEMGCHHEKQHQELLLTDIKYILGHNPMLPVYNKKFEEDIITPETQEWIDIPEGLYSVGHSDPSVFSFDNERGRHQVFLPAFQISSHLVTNREYLHFIEDGGYHQVRLWHSEGWEWVRSEKIDSPLYWKKTDGQWERFTLGGIKPVEPEAPLCHISYFEAFAFSQWKEMRLPTEFEWEVAQSKLHTGSRWEWTESAYLPYPYYTKSTDTLGEYNGKFMVNQKVLRGGSVASASDHLRPTYRNFFHPELRWQFTGVRLVKNSI